MKNIIYKTISYILILSMLSGFFCASVFAAETDAVVPVYQKIEGIEEVKAAFTNGVSISVAQAAALPSSVDLTSKFPAPGNQGSLNDGIEWALCYAKAANERLYYGWDVSKSCHHFSPEYIFNQLNDGSNLATNLYDVMNLDLNQGVCTTTYFPVTGSNYTIQPTARQKTDAKLYKTSDWVSLHGLAAIKNVLNSESGVLIAIRAYPDFNDISSTNPVYDTISGSATGEYVLCLVGYDNNKGGGAFKFINSKGSNWGINGYGWISYSLLGNSNVSLLGAYNGYYPHQNLTHDYLYGDVNGDSKVTSTDARLVLRYAAKIETPSNAQFVLADVNGDAKVNSTDANALQKYVAHTILQLPIYD